MLQFIDKNHPKKIRHHVRNEVLTKLYYFSGTTVQISAVFKKVTLL